MENKLWKKGLILGIIVMLFGVSVIPSTGSVIFLNYEQPDNVYVDDDFNESTPGWGYDHFDNIQDGVDAVNDSSTVWVFNGTYYENVVIDKTINIIGEDRNSTIIESASFADVVYLSISADWVNISGFTISNAEQNCNGIGVRSNFNSISGNKIVSNNYLGLYIYYSNNNTISNNNISNNDEGMRIEGSNNNTVLGNTLSSNNNDGINLLGSSNNTFKDNTVTMNNYAGIHLIHSKNCNIEKNIVTLNSIGIVLHDSSNYNLIEENKVQQNSEGILLDSSNHNILEANVVIENGGNGIRLHNSSYNELNHNNASIDDTGIVVENYSNNNTITGNNIAHNYNGILVGYSSDNNTIYHNNINNNSMNAADECKNTWDNGYPSGGNYWSDYPYDDDFNGPNQDIPGRDGIGDVPYEIPCEHGTDYYPLIKQNGWIHSPPNVPNKPSGETIILPGMSYPYNTSTIDPDNDSIWFKWDWGDGTFSDWLGPFDSGEEILSTHIWAQGTYEIKVKTKDSRNPETDWSEPLTINAIYPNLKTVLLFGFITNRTKSTDYYSFNAGKVLWINFNPIFPDIYSSNELIIVSDKYFGILLNWFIFGFFNAMVLT